MCTQKMLFVLPGALAGPRALGAGRRPPNVARPDPRGADGARRRRRSRRGHLGGIRRSGRRRASSSTTTSSSTRSGGCTRAGTSCRYSANQLADRWPSCLVGAAVGDGPLLSSPAAPVRRRPAALHPGRAHRRDCRWCPRRTAVLPDAAADRVRVRRAGSLSFSCEQGAGTSPRVAARRRDRRASDLAGGRSDEVLRPARRPNRWPGCATSSSTRRRRTRSWTAGWEPRCSARIRSTTSSCTASCG